MQLPDCEERTLIGFWLSVDRVKVSKVMSGVGYL